MQFCISRATSATTAQVLRATKVCCFSTAAAALMEFRTMLYYSTNTTAVL